jgi:hypothetical protein
MTNLVLESSVGFRLELKGLFHLQVTQVFKRSCHAEGKDHVKRVQQVRTHPLSTEYNNSGDGNYEEFEGSAITCAIVMRGTPLTGGKNDVEIRISLLSHGGKNNAQTSSRGQTCKEYI